MFDKYTAPRRSRSVQALHSRSHRILLSSWYYGSLVTWAVVSLATASCIFCAARCASHQGWVQSDCDSHTQTYPMGMPGCFPADKEGLTVKLTTHFHLLLILRTVKLYLHATKRLHGAVTRHKDSFAVTFVPIQRLRSFSLHMRGINTGLYYSNVSIQENSWWVETKRLRVQTTTAPPRGGEIPVPKGQEITRHYFIVMDLRLSWQWLWGLLWCNAVYLQSELTSCCCFFTFLKSLP
jgi:hypothetical protein